MKLITYGAPDTRVETQFGTLDEVINSIAITEKDTTAMMKLRVRNSIDDSFGFQGLHVYYYVVINP